jgi:hypothetical protein
MFPLFYNRKTNQAYSTAGEKLISGDKFVSITDSIPRFADDGSSIKKPSWIPIPVLPLPKLGLTVVWAV